MINRILGLLIAGTICFSSCKKETRNLQQVEDDEIKEYLQKNNLTSKFKKDVSGVYYEVLTEGNDSLKNSDQVYYLHEIKALGGDRIPSFNGLVTFSDTYSYNTNFYARINPAGFKASIKHAKLGGKVRAIVPSYLAYGKGGVGTQIRGNQILDIVFDVVNATNRNAAEDSLINRYVKTLPNPESFVRDSESGVYYHIISPGTGAGPQQTSTIKTAYTGKFFSGSVFDSASSESPLSSVLGGLGVNGWKIALPKIGKGGKIRILVPSYQAYGNASAGSIPPNTPLDFEIELLDF